MLYPLKFKPVYKDYPWGHTRLPGLFGRSAPAGIYAESWEVSTHPDGESVVANGAFAGQTFLDVLTTHGRAILGTAVPGNDFPLLIKLIDAAQPLSVQVHPNETHAALGQGDAKTELWYFLNDTPAQIYCGLKPTVTRAGFLAAVAEKRVPDQLRIFKAEKGTAAYIPGGRVHAADAGCLLLEVQQRSNTTYRVYDWDRADAAGQARDLHLDQAMQVINFQDPTDPMCPIQPCRDGVRPIHRGPRFALDELQVQGDMTLCADGECFHVLFSPAGCFELLFGAGQIESVAAGTSVLIPADLGAYTIQADQPLMVLKITVG